MPRAQWAAEGINEECKECESPPLAGSLLGLRKTSRVKAARRGQSHLLESRDVDKLFGILSARCVRKVRTLT